MADSIAAPVVLQVGDALAGKEPAVSTTEIQVEDESHPTKENENTPADIELTARELLCFWDAVTHCAEPENYKEITEMLKDAVKEEDQAKPGEAETTETKVIEAPTTETVPTYKVLNEFELEFENNRYQVAWAAEGKPQRHSAWPSEFCLVVTEKEGQDPYFQVFKTKLESLIIDSTNPAPTSQAYPELETNPTRLVYQFGRKYNFGPSALDEEGMPKIGHYPHLDYYNYAEHRILGDRLKLKFSDSETVVAGNRALNLENGNKLTYGQINGLGGDFFATNNPICTGSDFNQQCDFFQAAYNLLGKAESGRKEAPLIDSINQKEMQAVQDAISNEKSTRQAYKDLAKNDAGTISSLPLSKTDELLTAATMEREGPSYARMALLNLDHFGNDAHIAYNAGHTCAMRAAAAGNLELGYAMNAFADHYLGDCFASGHIRTPRRTLHASAEAIEKVCSIINDIYQEVSKGINASSKTEALMRGAKGVFVLPYLTAKLAYHAGDIKAIAPDVCSKFMHDEDNTRGLIVVNKRGDRWAAFGDTKLFEPENATNAKYMQQALQASADEVYQAYASKQVPSDVNSFAAWQIAPSGVDEPNCHRPLFREDGHFRTNWSDPWSSGYSDPKSWKPSSIFKPWDIPPDYPRLMYSMSGSDYFKNM